jgi:hypothetical protein
MTRSTRSVFHCAVPDFRRTRSASQLAAGWPPTAVTTAPIGTGGAALTVTVMRPSIRRAWMGKA